jgi:hypothetical protein
MKVICVMNPKEKYGLTIGKELINGILSQLLK